MSDMISDTHAFLQTLFPGPLFSSWELEQDSASLYARCVSLRSLPIGGDQHDDLLDAWRRQLEVFELIALVRHVDPSGWVTLMGKIGFRGISRCTLSRELPVFTVAFTPHDPVEYMESVISLVLAQPEDREHDEAFLHMKDQILAATKDEAALATISMMQIPMRIIDDDEHLETVDRIHRWLERSSAAKNRSLFRLVAVGFRPRHTLTPMLVEKVHRHSALRHHPIEFAACAFGMNSAEDTSLYRSRFHQFLVDITGPHGSNSLACFGLNHRLNREALFSALTSPRAMVLHRLELPSVGHDWNMSDRCSMLLWLLYGLFSQHARHAIGTLILQLFGGLRGSELEWFAHLPNTQAAPRLELLIPEAFDDFVSRGPSPTDHWVTVPRGHLIRLDERDDLRDHALCYRDQDMSFRVIRNDPMLEFIDILVPDYGRCWVERSAALVVEERPLTPWRFDQHAIRSLELSVLHGNDEAQHSISALLRLVGTPVQSLRINCVWNTRTAARSFNADFLGSIVRNCPQLERLVLCGIAPVDANAMIRAFELEITSLPSVVLESEPFVDRAELLRFLDALSDPALGISRKLRELAINLDRYESERMDESDLVEAVIHVLETNNTLRVVHLGLSITQLERFGTRFYDHRERFIAQTKAPLSMRAKCALLSALASGTPVVEDAVAQVFEFAAECDTRIVTIGACNPDGDYPPGRP